MKLTVILEPSEEGGFTVLVPALPDASARAGPGKMLKEFTGSDRIVS